MLGKQGGAVGLERERMGVPLVEHQGRPALRLRGHRLRWLGGGELEISMLCFGTGGVAGLDGCRSLFFPG